jgi:hypothetical protein
LSFEPQGHVSRQVPHGVSKSSDLPPRDQDREIQDTSDRFATGRPVRRPSMATIRGFLRPKHPTETRSADNVMKALEALQFDPADQASRPRSPPVHSRSSAQPPATAEDEG